MELMEVEDTYAVIPVQLVDCPLEVKIMRTFFDSVSTINLICSGWAEAAGLQGVPVTKNV